MLKLSNKNDAGQGLIYQFFTTETEKDSCLKDKLDKREYTTEELLNYAKECARNQTKNGVACIQDDVVFEWCKHYVLEEMTSTNARTITNQVAKPKEEEIEEDEETEDIQPVKEVKPKVKKDKKEKTVEGQLSIFDFIGE